MGIGPKSEGFVESGPDEKGRLFSLAYHRRLLNCRLCMRVGLIVLATIVVIEAVILLPSLHNYERDLLKRIEGETTSAIAVGLATEGLHPDRKAIDEAIFRHTPLRGGAFYGVNDQLLGTFGETPDLSIEKVRERSAVDRLTDDGARYELLWSAAESGQPYSIVARADATWLSHELWAFVLRIGGLVLLISSVVTLVTVLILGHIVLEPLLRLREKLNAASEDPEHPERYAVSTLRRDEFGDVVARFNGLLQLISSTHRSAITRVVTMTDNSLDGIVACDADGRFVYANHAALNFLGVSNLPALQHASWRLERAENGEPMSLIESLAEGPYSRELVISLPDGSKRPVLCSANLLTERDRRATLYYASFHDITERKRAERDLRQSEARLAEAQRIAHIGSWGLDLYSGELYWSDEVYRILGLDKQHATPSTKTYIDLIHSDDRPRVKQIIREKNRVGTPYSHEYRIVRPDGNVRTVLTIIEYDLDDLGRPRWRRGTIQDITERKRIENDLEAAKGAAEAANVAKSAFLANMSHELRTPLNAILGFSEIFVDEGLGELGSPQYKEYARDIHESGKHLLSIINDILDLSKIEAGHYALNEVPINARELVQSCLRMMAGEFKSAGLTVETHLPDDLPQLLADQRACKQILINLLANSRKFTPAGGRVSVTVELDEGARLCLSVNDTGVGIPRDHLDRVFKPFNQVDNSLARKHDGTGLGLTLVRSFVETHGGAIDIESEVGNGTTVVVRFPASRVVATTTEREGSELRRAGSSS